MTDVRMIDLAYNQDGALSDKTDTRMMLSNWKRTVEKFSYDINNLLIKFTTKSAYASSPTCFSPEISDDTRTEWRYTYNPFNEREQKRMYYSPAGDNQGGTYPWVYYQLGGNNEQLAVYNGFSLSDPDFWTSPTTLCALPFSPRTAFLYPVEYNSYGAGSTIDFSYRVDENGVWRKDYSIRDHLGNQRTYQLKIENG